MRSQILFWEQVLIGIRKSEIPEHARRILGTEGPLGIFSWSCSEKSSKSNPKSSGVTNPKGLGFQSMRSSCLLVWRWGARLPVDTAPERCGGGLWYHPLPDGSFLPEGGAFGAQLGEH